MRGRRNEKALEAATRPPLAPKIVAGSTFFALEGAQHWRVPGRAFIWCFHRPISRSATLVAGRLGRGALFKSAPGAWLFFDDGSLVG